VIAIKVRLWQLLTFPAKQDMEAGKSLDLCVELGWNLHLILDVSDCLALKI